MSLFDIEIAIPCHFWKEESDNKYIRELDFGNGVKRFVLDDYSIKYFNYLKSEVSKIGFFVKPQIRKTEDFAISNSARFLSSEIIEFKNATQAIGGNLDTRFSSFISGGSFLLTSPNLHLGKINKYFTTLKNGKLVPNTFASYLLKKIPVCLITKEDCGQEFRDYMNYTTISFFQNNDALVPLDIEDRKCRFQEEPLSDEVAKQIREKLEINYKTIYVPKLTQYEIENCIFDSMGKYNHEEGIIFIWLDKINEYIEKLDQYKIYPDKSYVITRESSFEYSNGRFQLLFQMILLRTFLYALIDIQWDGEKYIRNKSQNRNINQTFSPKWDNDLDEDAVINSLVLLFYKIISPASTYEFIEDFFKRQSLNHYVSVNMFQEEFNRIELKLIELIK